MAKRRADKQLNKDTADIDDEPEESGEFAKADSTVIATRVIKTAKRRLAESGAGPNPFTNFAGFSTAPKGQPFTFFDKQAASKEVKKEDDQVPSSKLDDEKVKNTNVAIASKNEPYTSFGKPAASQNKATENKEDNRQSRLDALKSLNISCLRWIQQHLEKSPYVILSPVFQDYENHLKSINLSGATKNSSSTDSATITKLIPSSSKETSSLSANKDPLWSFSDCTSSSTTTPTTSIKITNSFSYAPSTTSSTSSFGTTQSSSTTSSTFTFGTSQSSSTTAPTFTFGTTPFSSTLMNFGTTQTTSTTTATSTLPFFSFGSSQTSTSTTAFSFGASQTSTAATSSSNSPKVSYGLSNGSSVASAFSGPPKESSLPGTGAASDEPSQPAGENEPSDELPPAFVPVAEDGSVYNIRCKVFFKKDGQFSPVGVGTLYLKQVANGKTQLIARADTSQGSVILNFLLTPDLPIQRTGKNNVLIVCVPTPDAQPPPVPVLIRVKSAEERDALICEMEKLRTK